MEIYDAICIFLCFIGGTFPIPVLWYAVKWDRIRIFNGKGFPIPIDEMIYMIWFGVSVIIDFGLALQWIVEGRGTVPATCICVLAGLLTSICGSLLWMHTAEGRRNIMIIRARRMDKRLHRWRYSPTAAYGNNEVHLHPYLARRLSVAEALAIQGLPAGFMLPPDMSLTDKFKTVGNGVPFGLARGLAEGVSELMGSL